VRSADGVRVRVCAADVVFCTIVGAEVDWAIRSLEIGLDGFRGLGR
jgi:hypothetical protein